MLLVTGNNFSFENKEIMIGNGDVKIYSSNAGLYMSRVKLLKNIIPRN